MTPNQPALAQARLCEPGTDRRSSALQSFITGAYDTFQLVESAGSSTGVQVNLTLLGIRFLVGRPIDDMTNRALAPEVECLREDDFRLRVQHVGERFFFTLRHIRPMTRKHAVGHSSEQNRRGTRTRRRRNSDRPASKRE